MKILRALLVSAVMAAPLAQPVIGGDLTFQSRPGQRTSLVELYTSEGCSSCPPAEAALGRLTGSPRLWTDFVPVAFHVDYWDNLGWKDRFAARAFTARQRDYAARWGSSSVYTPGFVLDGREWRNGVGGELPAAGKSAEAGVLAATIRGDRGVNVTYRPAAGQGGAAREASVALLGFNLQSRVGAGENRGRDLRHDFVVLGWEKKLLALSGKEGQAASFELPAAPGDATRLALAVWVEDPGRASGGGPEQAVGGWLTPGR